ncbi:putative iron-regulated membrane protein [Novosphingobium kunmingense]|uniref:Putative iron-regulated membrane protein n=1 Tax=Novosphingobium kunmingense TaxID=1211806 RepID=A0A2N0H309_9SPHN|nr:PepSY-associated TM helix domain-containing protein [Novosphingobium kunmingense]PKB13280.1 putative iron-regulated membrane protein [Novosphingobium kunmingense]
MNRPRRASPHIKRLIAVWHLWLGVSLGGLWALQGLTGAMLVFHRDLDRAGLAAVSGPPRPLDELVAVAARAMDGEPESIGHYYPDGSILGVTFGDAATDRRTVLIEAASGRILGLRERSPVSPAGGNFWRWVYHVHHSLLLGERGEWLLGLSGLLLLTMAGSGAWLGWPRRGQWRAAYSAGRWRTRVQKLFGWHRAIGLAAALALMLLAASGAMMDFGKPLRAWAERHAGYQPPYRPRPGALPERTIGADRALALALTALPDAALTSIGLPTPKSPVYLVRLRRPAERRTWSGTSLVVVDAGSGRILAAYDAASGPLANRILDSAFPVHSGEVASLPGRILVFLTGLSLPVLYLTGLWAWLRRRHGLRDQLAPGSQDCQSAYKPTPRTKGNFVT